ncbi:transcription initiation factor TFIID subunit 11 [Iris pallida]|uniref:Transcription initiation factor TFIID subunit 11 n=1 Tax=Iris pallida TaxID=29817 RepID=A0AAX6F4B6_IRIPA|nr:transcription initiation factor TFIID subunit 11 [Iris pallida]
MKDPFEAASEDQESPPESPLPPESPANPSAPAAADDDDYDDVIADDSHPPPPAAAENPQSSSAPSAGEARAKGKGKRKEKEKEKEEEEEEEEEHMDVPTSGRGAGSGPDPDKMAKMQAILSQFTEEQMTRYESFRRCGFQKSIMKRLLTSLTGSQKISVPMTIVVSGIAKVFVGELIEAARTVMMEREESGPVRPCHIRESYRRLKLEGKMPKKSVRRRFF